MEIDNGFEIEILFQRDLTEEEQDAYWSMFIEFIESKKFSFGGGQFKDYLRGFIDISESKLNYAEAQKLLLVFFEDNNYLNKSVKIE